MKSLRLIWIELVLPRLTTFAENVLANDQLPAKDGDERCARGDRSAESTALNRSPLAKAFLSLMLLLLVPAATLEAFAQDKNQDREPTFGDSLTPRFIR
jgi:hypothetical protein